jgi:hypothetical protein
MIDIHDDFCLKREIKCFAHAVYYLRLRGAVERCPMSIVTHILNETHHGIRSHVTPLTFNDAMAAQADWATANPHTNPLIT